LAEDRRTPETAGSPGPDPDAEIEGLTRRIADVINSAGAESRQDLREYAIELLKEGTEQGDAPVPSATAARAAAGTNPIGIALLLGLVSLPLILLFLPVGLTMLAVAVVMGAWGILSTVFRR
jgi:hypothetical protein